MLNQHSEKRKNLSKQRKSFIKQLQTISNNITSLYLRENNKKWQLNEIAYATNNCDHSF